ncbi:MULTISPECIES: type 2 periplasmic-binding domain-containing protein [Shewanella]|uniref:Phosphate ABC transporter substrate-binding protein n=2 Tax=Shewanella TaxID=22 RepID=A0A975AKN8_9GAMM|nr:MULTISPECIES: phosphate ABC transporter substrate-binding protein [Shewanella]QSX30567.1 phosphate ABC transporter substrate-binding protein [Shewanella cyperi]QSX37780.1 phosphate ABC transporter substrate-binding protein [Shewanella sedimentimangrovi]QSX41347.1 phosphate ABC transporter substrate-binding protein [Shewanella cyperi]
MKKLLGSILLCLCSMQVFAGVAVIVHPSNGDSLDKKDIENIYLGKTKSFPGGGQAVPVNLEGGAVREAFDSNVLGKSASQLKAYWSQKVFTGKGTPPKEVASDAEVIGLVSSNPNIIGYIDSSQVNGSVKVIAEY